MKSVTEKEQQEICESMYKIVEVGMKTIKELGVAFGIVARAMYENEELGNNFYITIDKVNERIEAFKKKEIK